MTYTRQGSWWALAVLAAVGAGAVPPDARIADAAQNRDHALVRSLLRQHADANGAQADRTTALMWVAHWDDGDMVNLLLAAGANANATNRFGSSAFSEAAKIGDAAILEKLLTAGADPRTVSQNNESALMSVSRVGNADAVKLLLDHGADINARNAQQETALMYAVNEGHTQVVKLLIGRGADVNAAAHVSDIPRRTHPNRFQSEQITGGFTPLMFAARQGNNECAQLLLGAGADPHAADRDGMTPMIIAALNGHFDTAAVILEKGGDPNDGTLWETLEFRNMRRVESVGMADPVMAGELDSAGFVKLLLDHGADPTSIYGKVRTTRGVNGTQLYPPTMTSGLERASQSVDVETMRLMVKSAASRGIKFDADAILSTALQANAVMGAGKLIFRTVTGRDVADAVALSLDHGADVNAANITGNTPLHLAARAGLDDAIKVLAERGAMLDAKNKAGLTPLDLALGTGATVADRYGVETPAPAVTNGSTVALLRQLMAAVPARTAAGEKQ